MELSLMTKNKANRASRRQDALNSKSRVTPQGWQLHEAQARFTEVCRLARQDGPQRVTGPVREAVVVIAAEEYDRLTRSAARSGSLSAFFAASPLRGSGIDLDRPRDLERDVPL
jgi:prevent-host-death family protein